MKYIKVKTNMLLSIICAFFLLWTPALFNSGCAVEGSAFISKFNRPGGDWKQIKHTQVLENLSTCST